MWIFGYGSLIWRVDFPYEEKTIGYIKGFQRRFYQHSTDHRGTPEAPGRVVTLVPDMDEFHVWGVAYRIKDADVQSVIEHLDYREKGGYERMNVLFHPKATSQEPFDIYIYIGTEDNHNYAGEADDFTIAQQIVNSSGPSGSNIEYICKLAKSMREIAPDVHDEHLFNIEAFVLKLLESNN